LLEMSALAYCVISLRCGILSLSGIALPVGTVFPDGMSPRTAPVCARTTGAVFLPKRWLLRRP
jgi:hypothetical protein